MSEENNRVFHRHIWLFQNSKLWIGFNFQNLSSVASTNRSHAQSKIPSPDFLFPPNILIYPSNPFRLRHQTILLKEFNFIPRRTVLTGIKLVICCRCTHWVQLCHLTFVWLTFRVCTQVFICFYTWCDSFNLFFAVLRKYQVCPMLRIPGWVI